MHAHRVTPLVFPSLPVSKRPSCGPWRQFHQRGSAVYGFGGLGEELTDFLTAGQKLRRWYGKEKKVRGEEAEDKKKIPGPEGGYELDDNTKEYVLVTESTSRTAEQIILQLILNRSKVKVLCSNPDVVKSAYGPYVLPVLGTVKDSTLMASALKGVKRVVCVGAVGTIPSLASQKGVEDIVLISSTGVNDRKGFNLGDLWGESASLTDPKREAMVMECGLPYLILRCGALQDSPGGVSELSISSEHSPGGVVSREDVGWIVAASQSMPSGGRTVIEVVSTGPGSRPEDIGKVLKSFVAESVKT